MLSGGTASRSLKHFFAYNFVVQYYPKHHARLPSVPDINNLSLRQHFFLFSSSSFCISLSSVLREMYSWWKVYKSGVSSGPFFPAFGLNTERYFVSLLIQSECWKIRTRKKFLFGHFSRNALWLHCKPLK